MKRTTGLYHDLVLKEKELKLLLAKKEAYLREHRFLLEEELEPYWIGLSRVRNFFSFRTSNPALQFGIRKVTDFIFRHFFRSATRDWAPLIAPMLSRFFTSIFSQKK